MVFFHALVIFIVCVSSCFVWAISFDYVLWILVLWNIDYGRNILLATNFITFTRSKQNSNLARVVKDCWLVIQWIIIPQKISFLFTHFNHFLYEISSPRIKNSEVKNLRFCTALHFLFFVMIFLFGQKIFSLSQYNFSFEKSISNVFFVRKFWRVRKFRTWMSSKSF